MQLRIHPHNSARKANLWKMLPATKIHGPKGEDCFLRGVQAGSRGQSRAAGRGSAVPCCTQRSWEGWLRSSAGKAACPGAGCGSSEPVAVTQGSVGAWERHAEVKCTASFFITQLRYRIDEASVFIYFAFDFSSLVYCVSSKHQQIIFQRPGWHSSATVYKRRERSC